MFSILFIFIDVTEDLIILTSDGTESDTASDGTVL